LQEFKFFNLIKVTFLGSGTSQGVPVVACPCDVCRSTNIKDQRLRSSILIEVDHQVILIDAGPDFRYQMLRAGAMKLDAILITHAHRDHIAGLDDVRSFNFIYRKSMDIYASAESQKEIKLEFSYAFGEADYPGLPKYNLKTITDKPFDINGTRVIPLSVLHRSMEVYGFRIGDFAYITDTNYIPGSTLAQLDGVKYMVVSAVRKEPHVSHYNLEQAVNILQFINPEVGYITHLSHLMGFHNAVERMLPDGIRLAYDGLEIYL
jgi:phosphoribosyl 1,2-cyclic phosphate phosphodiesterase